MSNTLATPLSFVKLYGKKLLSSSLWLESSDVFKLFACMLCEADVTGFVDIPNVKALAHRAALSQDACETALAVLEAPDPGSRTKAHDGRRVLRLESGWTVVNAVSYRQTQTVKQAQAAARQEKWRKSKAKSRAVRKSKRRKEIEAFDAVTGNLAPDHVYDQDG